VSPFADLISSIHSYETLFGWPTATLMHIATIFYEVQAA